MWSSSNHPFLRVNRCECCACHGGNFSLAKRGLRASPRHSKTAQKYSKVRSTKKNVLWILWVLWMWHHKGNLQYHFHNFRCKHMFLGVSLGGPDSPPPVELSTVMRFQEAGLDQAALPRGKRIETVFVANKIRTLISTYKHSIQKSCYWVFLCASCGRLRWWRDITVDCLMPHFSTWNTMTPNSPSYSSTACITEMSLPFPNVWEADTCCGGRIAHSCGRTTGSTTCIFVARKSGPSNLTAGGFPVIKTHPAAKLVPSQHTTSTLQFSQT